jgi:hypothetical protein
MYKIGSAQSEAASEPSTSAAVIWFKISRTCCPYTKYASHFRSYRKKFQYIQHCSYNPPKETELLNKQLAN